MSFSTEASNTHFPKTHVLHLNEVLSFDTSLQGLRCNESVFSSITKPSWCFHMKWHCLYIDSRLKIRYTYTMSEADEGSASCRAKSAATISAGAELDVLQESEMGQDAPRIAGMFRKPELVIICWDKGKVRVINETDLPETAKDNATAARNEGEIINLTYPHELTPYRLVGAESVSRGRDGRLLLAVRVEDSSGSSAMIMFEEADVIASLAKPATFTERYTDSELIVREYPVHARHYTLVLPERRPPTLSEGECQSEPKSGIVLVPDPVNDTVSGSNQESYKSFTLEALGKFIAADVLSDEDGPYLVEAFESLGISFGRGRALEKVIGMLGSKVIIRNGEFVFNGILGVVNRRGFQKSLGITEFTVEGVQQALADLIKDELSGTTSELLAELATAMNVLAQKRERARW